MNLAAVPSLATSPVVGRWFRAVQPQFLPTALGAAHTVGVRSRFNPGASARPPFQLLYFAENHQVALFEVRALYGNPLVAGGMVPHPRGSWTLVSVNVALQRVVDLCDPSAWSRLDTSAQELTGDWQGYASRSARTSVASPTGTAPTQGLGEALRRRSPPIEAFQSLSACVPYCRTLMVFPDMLLPGSSLQFEYFDAAGDLKGITISG